MATHHTRRDQAEEEEVSCILMSYSNETTLAALDRAMMRLTPQIAKPQTKIARVILHYTTSNNTDFFIRVERLTATAQSASAVLKTPCVGNRCSRERAAIYDLVCGIYLDLQTRSGLDFCSF